MTDRRDDCMECGNWLPDKSRSDRLYCSESCRKHAYRREHSTPPAEKICVLCGAIFRPLRGKQTFCDFTNDADETCAVLQNERAQQQRELEDQRWDKECEHCGENTGWDGVGRPRRFCSNRCKTAFYRAERVKN
jgi:endogenous inhibitor of DNA gyrase (YacG/DUF329 family)